MDLRLRRTSSNNFGGGSSVKNPPAMHKMWVWPLGQEDPLGKEIAAHSSILAWKIPWMEVPEGLQSMGSQNSKTQLNNSTFCQLSVNNWDQMIESYCVWVNQRIEVGKHNESIVKWQDFSVKQDPQSLYSLRRLPQLEIIFSKTTLVIKNTVAWLQRKTSVQCENIQTMTKT